ncbi:unnamed protein product [Vitrella brassicaformis CCMP3155]|uniref:EB domain-containing protein n=2 Tax=Vitrella brassicaformis TaxID=1169539 RepID=A0A0G4GMJ3_VITBC|nr:unnamed protein product [Vitrella brassicaformis CCMP3155]|eukprot:CEM31406.1 unnamed protein product [Vitrella brassicaformis CCMP3155]
MTFARFVFIAVCLAVPLFVAAQDLGASVTCRSTADCDEGRVCANLVRDRTQGTCVEESPVCTCDGTAAVCTSFFNMFGISSNVCREVCDPEFDEGCEGGCAEDEVCTRTAMRIPFLPMGDSCACRRVTTGCSGEGCIEGEVCVRPGMCVERIDEPVDDTTSNTEDSDSEGGGDDQGSQAGETLTSILDSLLDRNTEEEPLTADEVREVQPEP